MPNGKIQPEFTDTLAAVGSWVHQNGESIYGTRGNIVPPQQWGVVTAKNKVLYAHILNKTRQPYIFIPGINQKVTKAIAFTGKANLKYKQQPEGVFVYLTNITPDNIDTIIQLETQ